MTNIDIANGLVFQALGISKDTFDDRLLSQKRCFYCRSWELILATPTIGMCTDPILRI